MRSSQVSGWVSASWVPWDASHFAHACRYCSKLNHLRAAPELARRPASIDTRLGHPNLDPYQHFGDWHGERPHQRPRPVLLYSPWMMRELPRLRERRLWCVAGSGNRPFAPILMPVSSPQLKKRQAKAAGGPLKTGTTTSPSSAHPSPPPSVANTFSPAPSEAAGLDDDSRSVAGAPEPVASPPLEST